jgi:predicted ATPase/DNA-binding winged helix-turn-helix (wHTH) protein
MTPAAETSLCFGDFELRAHERRLLRRGEPVELGGRAFDVLLALAQQPGRLVGKAMLMDLVWPGLVVQENNLAAQVSALRKVLGGDVITTVPGRGYRFAARIAAAGDGAPAAAPAPLALKTNLPAGLPTLLGRDAEQAGLGAAIDRGPLVSVVGPGGIGKSLLTQHVLATRRNAYEHGVCWVELGGLDDAAALPGTVAAALGVHGGHGDALAGLVSAVSALRMLLALDNAEHLLDEVAALCRALHGAAPGLRVVVTSQAPLRVPNEQVFRIGPLAVPDAALPPAEALRFGAVALFAERAHAVDRRFELSDANAAAVIETCRALDGLPLAIELAAARAPLLGVRGLLMSMRDRFALLTRGRDRAAPGRQRTLRAAIEWSCELLAEREQQMFRRLGVIAGSASLALIGAVLVDPGLDASGLLDVLDTLVDRSLVALSGDDDEPRYRLLETPRAYALECLDAAGERDALQRRHALAVASMFDAAYDEYFSGRVGADDWLHRREPDLDNARAALRWASEAGEIELALRIGATMLRALPPSLHIERMALADACEAAIGPELPEPLQQRAWLELSCVLADTQKARARRAAERALALARQLDARQPNRFMRYHALCRAASAAAQADDMPAARALLEDLQRVEDPSWPAQRLLWGCEAAQWVARMDANAADALRLGRRLLALDRERGSHASIATGNLIDAELAAGDAGAAARLGGELVEALRGTRHEYGLTFARINLLAALLAQDDVVQARAVAQLAWSKSPAFDLQHAAAAYLALFCALDGRPRAAVELAAYSEAIYAAREETRERNETEATNRALSIARLALDDAELARARAEGALLRDAGVAAIAFGGVPA